MSATYESKKKRDVLCDQFEAAWRENHDLRIESFIALQKTPLNEASLQELILLEIDLLNAGGLELSKAEYTDRFPEYLHSVELGFNRVHELQQTLIARSTLDQGNGHSNALIWSRASEIPARVGRYEILCQLGSGAFGVVYKARDLEANRLFALKFPQKRTLGSIKELLQLQNEALQASQLEHPSIATSYGVQEADGFLFSVQRFVDGPTLAQIETNDRSQLVRWLAEIAEGLSCAHEHGVIHRDLKPANIMIDRDGNAVIVDFGLALDESAQRRLKGQRCGSPPYMSPEQVMGLTHQMDGRSDIWSLGVVMYELLSGRRPFGGETVDEVYDEIKSRNEKPLCAVNPELDQELQRICLKCLVKPIRDRYHTAELLAKDLRSWLEFEEQWKSKSFAPLIPRGLRAFGPQDSEAYLSLLPGPRDRHGVPDSIQFWKHKIESSATNSNFSVGVVIGPSGSGKSSFVKAGLLPRLDSNLVSAVYVEASASNTESSLLSAIERLAPQIPEELKLEAAADGIKNGVWSTKNEKTVVVLDQFEQWLSSHQKYESSELVHALRHCDGRSLFCILLVRDDFWFAASRFVEAIGTKWNEDENVQRIDLFDVSHAEHVLFQIGRAMGKLPENRDDLNLGQAKFLQTAVSEISRNAAVISVHLTTFTEMFRNREWNFNELKKVGGVKGVGQQFLESNFGSTGGSPHRAETKQIAESILEQLLPIGGTGIRGAAKTTMELATQCGKEDQLEQFQSVLNLLERDLKIVALVENINDDGTEQRFQLTHDYLVEAIRDWLGSELQKTRRGRARIRIRELVSANQSGLNAKVLPTNTEWMLWQFLLPKKSLTENERALMLDGRGQFLRWAATAIVSAIVIIAVASYFVFRWQRANQLVENLMGMKIQNAPAIVEEIQSFKTLILPKLKQIIKAPDASMDRVMRAELGLLGLNEIDESEFINRTLLPNCSAKELLASHQISRLNTELKPASTNWLLSIFNDSEVKFSKRLRAAAILALKPPQKSTVWTNKGGLIFQAISDEPMVDQEQWINIFKPVGQSLEADLRRTLNITDDERLALVLIQGLALLYDSKQNAKNFADILADCNDQIYLEIHKQASLSSGSKFKQQLIAELEQLLTSDANPKRNANIRIALLKLGEPSAFVSCLADIDDVMLQSYAIANATDKRIEFETIRSLYLDESTDGARNALLKIFAEHAPALADHQQIGWLKKISEEIYLTTADAGCFSAAESIARRLQADIYAMRHKRVRQNGGRNRLGNVYIDSRGFAFIIIEPDKTNGLTYNLTVSTTALTRREFSGANNVLPEDYNLPYAIESFPKAIAFCNRMNLEDGIELAKCPMPNATTENELQNLKINTTLPGYRFMTRQEWFAINKASAGVDFLGTQNELANHYAIAREVSESTGAYNVASRLPNLLGLFDLYGNLHEITINEDEADKDRFLAVGGDYRQSRGSYSVTAQTGVWPAQPRPMEPGLRLVRTMLDEITDE